MFARTSQPTGTAVADLGTVDYADAYAVDLDTGTTAPQFMQRVMAAAPAWVRALLDVRDTMVRPFGLQTQGKADPDDFTVRAGRRVGPFQIRTVSDQEVTAGDDDKHLRFRTSFTVRARDGRVEGVCTTAVATNNRAGRAYFALIKPIHRLIMPRLIGRAMT